MKVTQFFSVTYWFYTSFSRVYDKMAPLHHIHTPLMFIHGSVYIGGHIKVFKHIYLYKPPIFINKNSYLYKLTERFVW